MRCASKKEECRRRKSARTHEKLRALHRKIFSGLPKSTEAQVGQTVASIRNIDRREMIAKLNRARSKAEFIAKCGDCLREAEETTYWLELLVDANVSSSEKTDPSRSECQQLIAIFVTVLKRAKQQ